VKSNQNEQALLAIWQETHGGLDSQWHQQFLSHPMMEEILSHPWEHVEVAVRRKKKLSDVLEDLYKQIESSSAFMDKWYPYRNSMPDPEPRGVDFRGHGWSDRRD